jgi:small multidrug resistance pump
MLGQQRFQRKRMIMAYVYLIAAIVAEVIGTSSLKASDGFSKLGPTLIVCAAFATAFFFLSMALRTIPVGVAYAIWSGVGTALIVLIAAVMFRQMPDFAAIAGITLIIAGVVVINLGSGMTH